MGAAIAVVSTFGDFVWATWIPCHRVIYGLTEVSSTASMLSRQSQRVSN